ncbi:unnamed protein product [Paramecium primaurelia]|uniref:Uncharacterized protein n=1 Tax=Paramecium primaurelia TaxID=5886 RepID=A0A8S1NWG1_PARPR|nr:unnamed protein product [Paramecium primaurelia]
MLTKKDQKQKQPQNKKQRYYDFVVNNTVKQTSICFAISINHDSTKIAVGSYQSIKIFQFKQEQMKWISTLIGSRPHLRVFNFMKNSSILFSGGDDNQLTIWPLNGVNNGKYLKKLYGHNNTINCLVTNNVEDIIISGSDDKSIKFWKQKNYWILNQTIIEHRDQVYGLSLNQSGNVLISCGQDRQILVIELQQKGDQYQWILRQTIKEQSCGYRLCFLNDTLFAFQSWAGKQMHIYQLNDENMFMKISSVTVKGKNEYCNNFFPQQYIQSKNLIVSKNGPYVNIIKMVNNRKFVYCSSVEFSPECYGNIFGQVSSDGEYLIIWDQVSSQIQIRKYMNS